MREFSAFQHRRFDSSGKVGRMNCIGNSDVTRKVPGSQDALHSTVFRWLGHVLYLASQTSNGWKMGQSGQWITWEKI